jgi:hypothetical protein
MPRVFIGGALFLLALVAAPNALATIEGPCTATIASVPVANRGTDARSDAIKVSEGTRVRVTMRSAKPIEQLKVELEFAGLRWAVHDEPTTGTSWTEIVDVDDYAAYGVGLYKVIGSSSGPGLECSGAALVDVDGSPLSTVAGIAGLALAIVGGLGVALLAFTGGGSVGRRVLGGVLGLLFGAGLAVLFQEFSILYPTATVAIVFLAGGAVLGAALTGLRSLVSPAY